MASNFPDQQPIGRIVGRRTEPPLGVPPSPEARAAFATLVNRLTRVPKGVIRYASHEEMTRDQERWLTEVIVATARSRG